MIYLANSIFQQKEQINDYYLFFSLHLFQSIHCGLHRSVQHIYKLRLTNNTNNSTCLHFQPLQRPPDRPTDIPIRSPRRRKAPPISDSSSTSQAQTHFFFHTIRPFSQTLLAHDLPNDEAQTHSMYISGRSPRKIQAHLSIEHPKTATPRDPNTRARDLFVPDTTT